MKKFLLLLFVGILVLAAVVVVKTITAPKASVTKAQPLPALPDSAVAHLQQAIQAPTISWGETKPIDTAAFRQFDVFLHQSYPLIHQRLSRMVFSEFSYLYKWTGTDTTLHPIILMGHYDVVPVEDVAEKMWRQKPFSGALVGDTVWGRGTCDDKGSVVSILESVEGLLRSGYQPRRTIYLSFGHDEELGGPRGASKIAAWLKDQGVKAEWVLDEGGMISNDKALSKQPMAVIGVQEKGYASYLLTVEKPGGHSSQPEPETAIDILAKGLAKLRSVPTPASIPAATGQFLEASATVSPSFVARMAINNQWLFGSVLRSQLSKEKRTNAMIRTALVPTMLDAGVKDNVIPTVATAVVNSRILPGETPESVRDFIIQTIGDDRVTVKPYSDNWWGPTNMTDTKGPAFGKVTAAAQKVMDGVIPAPYLVIGATDSRYFRAISTEVMNFVASSFMEGYHGIDERLPVTDYQRMIAFITHLIKDAN